MTETVGTVEVAVQLNMTPFDRGTVDLKTKVNNINTSMMGIGAKAFDNFASTAKSAISSLTSFSGVASVARMAASALGGPIAILAGGAGLAGLAAAAVNVVEKFAAFEQQMLTINAVLKSTEGASGKTADSIKQLSKDISNSTLQSGSDVRAAALSLLTFRNVATDTFDRALKLSADLAAVGFGSIETAAFTLGRALEQPSEGLSRLSRAGITFSNTQKLMMKQFEDQGNIVASQTILLDGLEKKVGGAGSAQTTGLSGSFDRLTKSMAATFTKMGGQIVEATSLGKVLDYLTEQSKKFRESMEAAANVKGPSFKDYGDDKFWKDHQAAVDAAAAANAQAKDKIDGVKIALNQQVEALQRTERGQKIYEQAQKAGVVGNKEAEAAIGRLIAKEEELALKRSVIPTSFASFESYKQSMLNEEQAEVQSYLRRLEELKSYRQQGWMTEQEYNAKVEAERARNSYVMVQFAQKQADIETDWRMKSANEAVNLLTTLGAKSKALAIAGIALSKAVAIASVIQSASAASVAALAPPPIGAGPIVGAALAASIQTFAALQIGLIAATGIAQAAQAGGSSASLSSPSGGGGSTAGSADTTSSGATAAAPKQISAISIDGIDPAKMFSGKQLKDLLDRVNDATKNGATLISTKNLRTT